MTSDEDEWVGSAAIAERLGVDAGTVRNWVVRGTDEFPRPRKGPRDNLWSWRQVREWAVKTHRPIADGY